MAIQALAPLLHATDETPFGATFFNDHFTLLIAQTDDEQHRAFALRHTVFIEELQYTIGTASALDIERDEHDQHSLLCLLHHNASGMDIGCVRVVLIEAGPQRQAHDLPLEKYYPAHWFIRDKHPHTLPFESVCEVSRLALHPAVRKKPKASASPMIETPYHSIRESPALLSLSLFLAATAMVGISKRYHVFAMLEPRFSRLLKASGLHFQQVGGVIDYCGSRAPYYIDQRVAEAHLPKRITPLYRSIKAQLAAQLTPPR